MSDRVGQHARLRNMRALRRHERWARAQRGIGRQNFAHNVFQAKLSCRVPLAGSSAAPTPSAPADSKQSTIVVNIRHLFSMQSPVHARTGQYGQAQVSSGKRDQIRRVQRRDNGEAEDGGVVRRSTRSTGSFGKTASEDAAGINPICTGATIRAEDSLNAGMGAVRWQHGGMGAEAGDDPRGKAAAWPSRWVPLFAIWLCVIWLGVIRLFGGAMGRATAPGRGSRRDAERQPQHGSQKAP